VENIEMGKNTDKKVGSSRSVIDWLKNIYARISKVSISPAHVAIALFFFVFMGVVTSTIISNIGITGVTDLNGTNLNVNNAYQGGYKMLDTRDNTTLTAANAARIVDNTTQSGQINTLTAGVAAGVVDNTTQSGQINTLTAGVAAGVVDNTTQSGQINSVTAIANSKDNGANRTATCIVDQTGKGDFTTIQGCIDATTAGGLIHIRKGDYYINTPLTFGAASTYTILEGEGWDTRLLGNATMNQMLGLTAGGFNVVRDLKLDCNAKAITTGINLSRATQTFLGDTIDNVYVIRCHHSIEMERTDGVYMTNVWTASGDSGLYGGGSGIMTCTDCKLNGNKSIEPVGNAMVWLITNSALDGFQTSSHVFFLKNIYMEQNKVTLIEGTSTSGEVYVDGAALRQNNDTYSAINGTFELLSLKDVRTYNAGSTVGLKVAAGVVDMSGTNTFNTGMDLSGASFVNKTLNNVYMENNAAVYFKNTSGSYKSALSVGTLNELVVGPSESHMYLKSGVNGKIYFFPGNTNKGNWGADGLTVTGEVNATVQMYSPKLCLNTACSASVYNNGTNTIITG
jgi:hypothetical protein